jgi:hypothetical protein
MSELDKFKGTGSSSNLTKMPAKVEGTRLPWERSTPKPSTTAEAVLTGKRGHFAIALDATGSMTPLIEIAKATISKIMSRVVSEANMRVQLQLFVFRDYDVPQIVIEHSQLSEEATELARWLGGITATGGGGNDGEAIEEALLAIERVGPFDAVLLAGDEPYNSRAHLDRLGKHDVPTGADIARRFSQNKCPIHTFLVGGTPSARKALEEIASISGGCFGKLDGSEAMIDMAVLAMLADLKGPAFVKAYMEQNALSHSGREFGTLLLRGPGS